MELLADQGAHGNVRNFEKLREPLAVHVSLDSTVPHEDPLHPSLWDPSPTFGLSHPKLTWRSLVLGALLFAVVVLELSRRSVGSGREEPDAPRREGAQLAEYGHGSGVESARVLVFFCFLEREENKAESDERGAALEMNVRF